jgi:hypothetical protein
VVIPDFYVGQCLGVGNILLYILIIASVLSISKQKIIPNKRVVRDDSL